MSWYLLKEDGDRLLQEDNDPLLYEVDVEKAAAESLRAVSSEAVAPFASVQPAETLLIQVAISVS